MQFTIRADFSKIPVSAWNELASASITDTPFARHEYLNQWWQTRGGGEWPDAEIALIAALDDQRLVGIAPLFTAKHDGRKTLLLIGSIEISDYLDFIVRAADLDGFVTGLLDFIQGSPALAHLPLDLFNIPQSSPTLKALRSEAELRRWQYHEEIYRRTPHIILSGSFEDYLASLDKKQRHEIRRKLRRASEGPTPARFELMEDPDLLQPAIEDVFELMTHDEDKRRFLSPPMRDQMRALMQLASQNGYLWLAFLNVNGRRAAAALNFDYGNKLWGYNSAVNRDFSDLSPGWVLLANQIRWACEHGRTEFDFMRGDEAYKYRFGAVDRHVMRACLTPT